MTDDEQNLTALEEELRAMAARDREEAAQLAADMQARMLNGVLAEYARKTVRRHMYRVGSAVALLAALAVAGVLLLPDGESALVQTDSTETETDVQPVNAPAVMIAANDVPVNTALVPESAPEMAVAMNSRARLRSMPTPDAGAGMPAPMACRVRGGEPSLQERVTHILTTQEQPYAELHATLSQAPTHSLQITRGDSTLTVTTGQGESVYIFIQHPRGEKKVISLNSPSDTLPPEVGELLK